MHRSFAPLLVLLCACGEVSPAELEGASQALLSEATDELTLAADSDTFVRDSWVAAYYGRSPVLEVKQFEQTWNRRAFLRFPIGSFKSSLSRATLRAFGSFGRSPITVAAFGSSPDWSEETLSFYNQPSLDGAPLSTQTIDGTSPRWYEWDVTSYVQEQKTTRAQAISFALESLTYGHGIASFASRESGANAAELVITESTFNPPPTVATAPSATPNPVSATTVALAALGADDGGEEALTYTWSATAESPAPVVFASNGTNAAKATTATFRRPGTYTLRVTIADANGATVKSDVRFEVVRTETAIAIHPANQIVPPGGAAWFYARVLDQFGDWLGGYYPLVWSVSGGGTVDEQGKFLASSPSDGGTFEVTASAAGITGSTTVTVLSTFVTESIPAAADAFVRDGTAVNNNFGEASTLDLKTGTPDLTRRVLLAFDLGKIPETITRARLRFHAATTDAAPLGVQVRGVHDAWSESSVTWASQPSASASLLAAFATSGPPFQPRWYEVDVYDYVRAEKGAGRESVSFQLAAAASTASTLLAIDSRYWPTTGPQLEVVYPR